MDVNIFSIIERVKKIKNVSTDTAVAKAIGISRENLNGYKSKGTIPYEALLTFASDEGISSDFIFWGREDAGKDPSAFTIIPKYKLRLSGGPGAFVLSQDIESNLFFKSSWISARCNSNQCGLFEIRGDSMAPVISHGDIVLVDMAQTSPEDIIDGKIYAFSEWDKIRIKRLFWKGNELRAASENKNENQSDGVIDTQGFKLIGRVIWVGHEVG